MAIERGSAFLLKVGDGAATPAYATVAGLRTTQASINGEAVVVTNKGSGGWRELLSGAGTRSVSVAGAGVFTGSAAELRLKASALSGVLDDYELSFESGERLRGRLRPGEHAVSAANPLRGEASLPVEGGAVLLRPSFGALVAAEEELGPLFALVERAAAGGLSLREVAALFWHCVHEPPAGLTRERLGEAVVAAGLAAIAPILRSLLAQILKGR
jgi:predicted secreted protein